MKPLFSCLVELETLTPPRALTRLARGGVCVYDAEKIGAGKLRFRVKSKDLRKIFAIFPRSCYTIRIIRYERLKRAAEFIRKRAALCVAALAFALLCGFSDFFVLRVRFEGSGSHYADDAMPLLAQAGLRAFSPYSEEKAKSAERALYSLPSVSFCAVEKDGPVVTVTLEVNAEVPVKEMQAQLLSPAAGKVEQITVIRGSALVSEGDEVEKGQPLVTGHTETGEGENVHSRETYPVAWCTLLCGGVFEYESAEISPDAEERARTGALLSAAGEVTDIVISATEQGGVYIYRAAYTYRLTCSVNASAD